MTEEESNQGSIDDPSMEKTHLPVSEDPEQAAFEEDNLNEEQKCWLARVRMLNATKTVDISGSKDALSFAMNSTIKGRGKLMADGCADTSIAAIGNGFREITPCRTDLC